MNRQRMTWGGKSATGPALPIEEAARLAAEAKKASAHPQTPDEGITHPAGYADPTQPAAYENGDTSSWAEDVHGGPYRTSPAPAVPVDDGGYKHPATQPGAPAKNASDLRAAVEHKAAKCLRIASAVLGNEITAAAEAGDKVATGMIEDQALDFMDLPDARLAATLRRLEAAKEDPEQLLRKMLAGEEGEEEEEEEEVEETASKKASDDKMAEVMSMLAGLQAQLAEMKSGGGHKAEAPPVVAEAPVDADEALLAEMLAEEAKVAEAPVAGEDVQAEALLQAMLAEEAKVAEAPAPVAEAPVEAGKSLAQYLEDDMGISMDALDDPMGLLGDPMLQGGDDEVLASLFASDVKVAKKAEDEEEVEEEGDDAAEGEDEEVEEEAAKEDEGKKAAAAKAANLRPQPKKAGSGAKTVGTQVRTAGARNELAELANIWESAPDVSKAFKS